MISGPADPKAIRRFLDSFMYGEEAVLVDEITSIDSDARTLEARFDTTRALPFSQHQRINEIHPAHIAAPELVMITGILGCLHAFLFHGCHWDEGWVGFGSRIHRADFKRLAQIGLPLRLESRETKHRTGEKRVVIRFEFHFWQEDALVYFGDQTAMFVRDKVPD